jgi:predicted outer membrane repeat protein
MAVRGDSILVADGLYYESVTTTLDSVLIGSMFDIDNDSLHIENTIIDGNTMSRAFNVMSESVTISGITIQNTYASSKGAGVYFAGDIISIQNCKFINNATTLGPNNYGGAIYLNSTSSADILNCYFEDNEAREGGAIAFDGSIGTVRNCHFYLNNSFYRNDDIMLIDEETDVVIENCLFEGSPNGSIREQFGSDFQIYNSTFINCTAGIRAQSGDIVIDRTSFINCGTIEDNYSHAFYTGHGTIQVSNTIFKDNQAENGACIEIESSAKVTIEHCQFFNNYASNYGGAIYGDIADTLIINSSTFWNNTNEWDAYGNALSLSGGVKLIKNTIMFDRHDMESTFGYEFYYSLNFNSFQGEGFSADTLFVDANSGDFNLRWRSPAIDAGDPTFALDPDGTRSDIGALYFNQLDTIPPMVELNYPEITQPVMNGDVLLISWSASDNLELTWAKLFFTSDGGESFILSDSVDAILGEIEWIAPDVVSWGCNLAIWVSDLSGNVSTDTLVGSFAIEDGTPPIISIINPSQDSSVREYDSLFVSWNASDNIGIELFELWYSNRPSSPFENQVAMSSDDSNYRFQIGAGVSDSARIKIVVTDLSANTAESVSDYFSITDNTSPQVSILEPFGQAQHTMASNLLIKVFAQDNVGVSSVDLNYSIDGGAIWTSIAEGLLPESDTLDFNWVIPNIPGQCQIQAVAHDAVNLTADAISPTFTVVIEYPIIVSATNTNWPTEEVFVQFSHSMSDDALAEAIQITGDVQGNYDIDIHNTGGLLSIKAINGFRSLDTLHLVLNAEAVTNLYGYGLDGNRNGTFEGSPTDDVTLTFYVNAPGDYNQDGLLDFSDFSEFVLAWHAHEYRYELAPNTYEIPHISIQPDSLFNIFDLATFASMWNWNASFSNSAPLTTQFQYAEFVYEQVGNALTVALPINEYTVSQTIIKYDPNLVSISLANQSLAKVSSNGLSLVDTSPDSGFILITSSLMSESSFSPLQLNLEPISRQRYSIEVAFQGSDGLTEVVQKRSLIELLPIPTNFSLSQNYPNPFNASTTIEYGLPKDSDLSISIYDIRGRFVRDVYSGDKRAGYHTAHWNGSSDDGQNVASGLYFIVLHTPDVRMVRKALIMK